MLLRALHDARELVPVLELSEVGSGNSLTSGFRAFTEHLSRLVATEAATPDAALLLILVRAFKKSGRSADE
jgi:hypothetical protein